MDSQKTLPSISVITATYNAFDDLSGLIKSLRQQTDQDFEWIVADGVSTDGTLELLSDVDDLNIVVSSQPDFGIYDALNRAIGVASGDYYIVAGADDFFFPEAIENFKLAIRQSCADFVVASAMYANMNVQVKDMSAWIVGQSAYIASHVLATAIKKTLHDRLGFYSRKYPLAADQLFIMNAFENGASCYRAGFIAGEIGAGGASSVDKIGCATELFRVNLTLGRAVLPQYLMLFLRLLRELFSVR